MEFYDSAVDEPSICYSDLLCLSVPCRLFRPLVLRCLISSPLQQQDGHVYCRIEHEPQLDSGSQSGHILARLDLTGANNGYL